MRLHETNAILARLPRGRTKFLYFRDRYALMLLAWASGEGRSVRELRETPLASLLQKPLVKSVLAGAGDGRLSARRLDSAWPAQPEAYRLTVGAWGEPNGPWDRWYQTSRPGVNLVLHLNFSNRHNAAYRRWLDDGGARRPFECRRHPRAGDPHRTLAWARLDVDVARGEALIEEIQSDWIDVAVADYAWVRRVSGRWSEHRVRRLFESDAVTVAGFARYMETALRAHVRLWSEATLAAALWFLRAELGVRRVYYHTFTGGNALKGLRTGDAKPPRSLYTTLPRRFCFRETLVAPAFLRACRTRKVRNILRRERPRWLVLET